MTSSPLSHHCNHGRLLWGISILTPLYAQVQLYTSARCTLYYCNIPSSLPLPLPLRPLLHDSSRAQYLPIAGDISRESHLNGWVVLLVYTTSTATIHTGTLISPPPHSVSVPGNLNLNLHHPHPHVPPDRQRSGRPGADPNATRSRLNLDIAAMPSLNACHDSGTS